MYRDRGRGESGSAASHGADRDVVPATRFPSLRRLSVGALVGSALAGFAVASANGAPGIDATALEVEGMTFVGSRAGIREVVLRSATASLRPKENIAELSDVRAELSEDGVGRNVSMTCARVELDIETNDFLAEGDVRGETADGQEYTTTWVRYQHEEGLLYTDAPVQMNDRRGSFRGDGFRYHVQERRFELLGNVRVEQRP
ncbi:MAG: LPS export ABC transporter periplasmic protein LptC [Myxococcales bacterium]|nr:LPS export ABC transporter periplasmic protein LptC [Myxococcales bacterium]